MVEIGEEAGIYERAAEPGEEMAEVRSADLYMLEAMERLRDAYAAWERIDIPLTQDKLDEALYSVTRARGATGWDHHHASK